MEGKEVRFGIVKSALWATVTTDTSCGAVNSMHDSYTPLGGLVPLVNMQLGEMIFGGVGSGLYGMIVMAVLAVFIAGLMVGRTPEYLGKKIEAREMKLAMLLRPDLSGRDSDAGRRRDRSPKPGLPASRIPGRTASRRSCTRTPKAGANNGSAFAGLNANTAVLQRDARDRDAVRALHDGDSRRWRWPARSRPRSQCRQRRNLPDRRRRSSCSC